LVEEAQHKVDHVQAAKLAKKISKGRGFDLNDLRDQMLQMEKMGGISSLMDKMPGMGKLPANVREQMSGGAAGKEVNRMVAIINSMTQQERRHPAIIKGSRKRRIAAGSGVQVQEVNKLMKQYAQMSKMMKKVSKGGGMAKMMRSMKGQMPPGMGF